MDTDKIIAAVSAIFSGADERNWEKVSAAMADEVMLDYSSLSGSPAANLASAAITGAWKGFLPGFDRTHHQLFDFRVVDDGDGPVKIYFKGKADHFIDGAVWTVEGDYDAELIIKEEKWLVASLTFKLMRQSGDTSLPAKAADIMAR